MTSCRSRASSWSRSAPTGSGEALDATRLTPGHFAAPAEADPGRWRFEVVATTEGGTVLQAIQEQEIGA